MSEALLGVIIGASFGFLGALTGILANTYLDSRRARRERTREVWLRLVGNRVQSSEVTEYIQLNRRRRWPRFWEFSHPDLSRAHLEEIDLRGKDMSYVNLFRADFSHADLDYVNFSHADLSKADMSNADLSGANLNSARLGRADLSYADLYRANLRGAKLSNANLSHAHLGKADLTGADLTKANLTGANLTGTVVSPEQLALVSSLDGAVLPEGIQIQNFKAHDSLPSPSQ
jgi:uncharacterized protein YjbI with pentapeptide repeats